MHFARRRSIIFHKSKEGSDAIFHHPMDGIYEMEAVCREIDHGLKGTGNDRQQTLIDGQEFLVESTKPACAIMKMNLQNPMALEPITTSQTH